jgi:hypothetical protein
VSMGDPNGHRGHRCTYEIHWPEATSSDPPETAMGSQWQPAEKHSEMRRTMQVTLFVGLKHHLSAGANEILMEYVSPTKDVAKACLSPDHSACRFVPSHVLHRIECLWIIGLRYKGCSNRHPCNLGTVVTL